MSIATDLAILQHALGVDRYGRGEQFRSHFVAGPGHSDYDTCRWLVERGLMWRRDRSWVVGGTIFFVTDAGRAFVAKHSPAPPKLTRSQQRYQRYLDADLGISFGDFMRMEARA